HGWISCSYVRGVTILNDVCVAVSELYLEPPPARSTSAAHDDMRLCSAVRSDGDIDGRRSCLRFYTRIVRQETHGIILLLTCNDPTAEIHHS
ncbi:hypothetical protein LINPERPRIM_LOCUS27190, partial [Linum perenne]